MKAFIRFSQWLIIMCLMISLSYQPVSAATGSSSAAISPTPAPVLTVHVFGSVTCPHCQQEKLFLQEYQAQHPEIKILFYYIEKSDNNYLLQAVAQELNVIGSGVPLTIVGDQYLIGFDKKETTGAEISSLIDKMKTSWTAQSIDPVVTVAQTNQIVPFSELMNSLDQDGTNAKVPAITDLTDDRDPSVTSGFKVRIPLLGQLDLTKFSLPAVAMILGLLDGFNPCAMWILLFLISLLLGVENKTRRWTLGVTFILASSLMYFLFMAAWLNFFMFIGMVIWVRVIIGVFALGAGVYYLKDFKENKDGTCKVDLGGKKQKIFEQLKSITYRKHLLWALIGIILLAFAVNLVELLCSAGLPALFTQILAINHLATWQRYLYLVFYIFFFMLDDLLVFFIAMLTMQNVGLNSKFSRYSHLIGGILMLLIGLAMLFKPELLTF